MCSHLPPATCYLPHYVNQFLPFKLVLFTVTQAPKCDDSCRTLDSIVETKSPFEAQNGGQGAGGRTLRHFFDDWPKSLHETESVSATNLSISMPGNPSSDFSLKLGTGNGDESRFVSGERERPQLNWATAWETGRVAPMGGPLAEALRSSMSTSSPTSVLHRLPKSSTSEASYVSS